MGRSPRGRRRARAEEKSATEESGGKRKKRRTGTSGRSAAGASGGRGAKDRPRDLREHLAQFPRKGVRTAAGVVTVMQSVEDENIVVFLLDGVESSALHLDDPAVLDFEYMDLMTRALSALPIGERRPLTSVHLGGAACALPRAWAHLHEGSHHTVVEVDHDVAALAREWFDLPRSPAVRIRVGDGREVLAAAPEDRWDVVVRDAFAAGVVPAHMRTRQFVSQVRRVLRPGGVYMANLADSAPLQFARAEAAALREQFAHVVGMTDPAVLSGRRFGNVVLLGCDEEIPVADVDRALRGFPLPITLMDEEAAARFAAAARVPDDGELAQMAEQEQPRLDAHEF